MNLERSEFGCNDCEQFVRAAPGGSVYHLPDIQRVIRATFGHDTVYMSVKNAGEVVGILPLVHMQSRVFGNFLISIPFFNYGGVCAEDPAIRQVLLEAAILEAQRKNCLHIELRHTSQFFENLQNKHNKVAMLLDLPATTDELWKAFKSKLRSQIRKPEKEGVVTKVGHLDLVDDFYSVFSMNMRDLGTPVYTKKLFVNMLNAFPKTSWIVAAYKDNVPIAAGFLLGFRNSVEIPWASSLRTYNRLAANMLMYWEALKLAINEGYQKFDFGRSTLNVGTYKFKAQWGAKPVELYWEYWVPNGSPLPDISPENTKYQAAIRIWQKLPVPLTRIIGPPIVRNIP